MDTLTGPTITLRRAETGDADHRLEWGNNPEIQYMFGHSISDSKPLDSARARQWVQSLRKQPYSWVIVSNSAPVGEIRLHSLNLTDQRAALAIGIYKPDMLGKGIGTEAIFLVLKYAFTTLNLHRISIRVLAFNERAIRAYQKCGFQIEGHEREACLLDGKRYDDVIMGLLKTEFHFPF